MPPGTASTIAESTIAAWGVDGGVHGLVSRWRERAARLAGETLTWEYQEAGLFPARHQAPADHGIFVLDPDGTHGDWVLKFEWREWGWRALDQGGVRELKEKALQILRSGGPFGGPSDIFRNRSPTRPWPPSGMVRHAAPAGELRVGELVPGVGALLHVAVDGTFAQRALDAQGLTHDPAELARKLGEVETLVLAGERVPWIFTDVWPLLGRIKVSAFDLLSCWLTRDEVAIIAARDGPYGVFVGTWADVRALDVDRWLAGLPTRPLARPAPPPSSPVVSSSPVDLEASPPSLALAGGSPLVSSPSALPGSTETGCASPEPSTSPPSRSASGPPLPPANPARTPLEPSASPASRRTSATIPPRSPATPARVEPVQAMKLPQGLADALAACFAVVEGDLPARETGAKFARELVWALVRAASAGTTTMTGTPAELLTTLHRLGFLQSVPSDQVGRDALKMLAERTSLVRRIHHRRWRLAFGDLLEPESTLREELRRYEPTEPPRI